MYNFNKITDILNEKSNVKYSYCCAMIFFDFPELNDITDNLDIKDIYNKNNEYGIEDEPHITLLYGLHEDVNENDVISTMKKYKVDNIILHNVSVFYNEEYNVLKFDVKYKNDNDFLHRINEDLRKYPHTNKYLKYHPHSTISYIKKGMSKKYIDMFKGKEYIVKPNSFVYSKTDGTKKHIQIKY